MRQPRSPWLDNAKAILIVLVVWGHLIEQVALLGGASHAIYGAMYVFNMPAFAMICGILARPAVNRAACAQMARQLLLPLVIFQILYWPFLQMLAPHKVVAALTPLWILWFLASLVAWRLILPLFVRLPYPLLTAVGLALAAGFVGAIDQTLGLSRTLFFFPAFLFGHLHGRKIVQHLRTRQTLCALAFALICIGATWIFAQGVSVRPLFGSLPYAAMSDHQITQAFIRLAAIAFGIAASVFFLALVPDKATRLSPIGRQTFTIYILHGFVVVLFWAIIRQTGFGSEPGFLTLSAVLAVTVALALARLGAAMPQTVRPMQT